jgi:hypothetical protein
MTMIVRSEGAIMKITRQSPIRSRHREEVPLQPRDVALRQPVNGGAQALTVGP